MCRVKPDTTAFIGTRAPLRLVPNTDPIIIKPQLITLPRVKTYFFVSIFSYDTHQVLWGKKKRAFHFHPPPPIAEARLHRVTCSPITLKESE